MRRPRKGVEGGSHPRQWITDALARIPRPEVPASQPWDVSLGRLLPAIPGVPGFLMGFFRGMLDRLGQVHIGPEEIGVNGQRARWDRVDEVRLREVREVVTEEAAQRLADRLAQLVPPFVPWRGKLVGLVVEAVFGAAARAVAPSAGAPVMIPTEIVYRGRFGARHRLRLGLFPLLVLALVPQANQCVVAMAGQDRVVAGTGPVAADDSAIRRRLIIGLCVWVPIALFWLLAAVSAGATHLVVLILGPFLLVVLAYFRGLGTTSPFLVYPLGFAPVLSFLMGVDWTWPIGLLIIVMIFAYEKVLEACAELGNANRKRDDDIGLAKLRIERLTLLWVSFDASAAGLDVVFLVVMIVAIIRMGRFSTVLALAAMAVSLVAFLDSGDPSAFAGLGQLSFASPEDIDYVFTLETFISGILAWGRTVWRGWRTLR